MQNFPDSVVFEIFTWLYPEDLVTVSRLCKKFFVIAQSPTLWENWVTLYSRDQKYPIPPYDRQQLEALVKKCNKRTSTQILMVPDYKFPQKILFLDFRKSFCYLFRDSIDKAVVYYLETLDDKETLFKKVFLLWIPEKQPFDFDWKFDEIISFDYDPDYFLSYEYPICRINLPIITEYEIRMDVNNYSKINFFRDFKFTAFYQRRTTHLCKIKNILFLSQWKHPTKGIAKLVEILGWGSWSDTEKREWIYFYLKLLFEDVLQTSKENLYCTLNEDGTRTAAFIVEHKNFAINPSIVSAANLEAKFSKLGDLESVVTVNSRGTNLVIEYDSKGGWIQKNAPNEGAFFRAALNNNFL
jgi:hypothetical protein